MSAIPVLFGTETGNAEECANTLAVAIGEIGFEAHAVDMQNVSVEHLANTQVVFIICSTTGEGEAPYNAAALLQSLQHSTVGLPNLGYGVCGLGDRTYENFAQAGKDFDAALTRLGAVSVVERVDCDDEYEEEFGHFMQLVLEWLLED